MERINDLLKERKETIDNIDIDNKYNNISIIDKGFVPRTEVEQIALEIATKLGDLEAIKFHLKVVNSIGVQKARKLLALTIEDVKIGEKKGKPIRFPARLYNWKVQNHKKY